MIFNYLKELNGNICPGFFLPEIGHYYLNEKDFLKIKNKKPDLIFIIDLALQEQDVLTLSSFSKNLFIFDHHKQKKIGSVNHINPQTDENKKSADYPSAGWVINDFFNKEQNVLSMLGAIGDQGEKVRHNPDIIKILHRFGSSFDECREIVRYIDSCYIANNRENIYRVMDILGKKPDDIRDILTDPGILRNLETVNKEIERILKEPHQKDGKKKIILKNIKSSFHIISDVCRILSEQYPDFLVIIINSSGKDIANIYFRTGSNRTDLTPLLEYAKQNGYNAGGKNEVVGIFCPVRKVTDIINDAKNILKL